MIAAGDLPGFAKAIGNCTATMHGECVAKVPNHRPIAVEEFDARENFARVLESYLMLLVWSRRVEIGDIPAAGPRPAPIQLLTNDST